VGRGWIGVWTALGAAAVAASARAELRVSAVPVLGPNSPHTATWVECAVRLDNDEPRPARGTLELESSVGYGDDNKLVTRASYAVGAGATATVRLPTRGFQYGGTPMSLRVLAEDGREVTSASIPAAGQLQPFLVDVSEPPRLATALRDLPVATTFEPMGGWHMHSSKSTPAVATGGVRVDPATGDPVLPERAAGYAGASVVVMRSPELARLAGLPLDALANYVLGGGSLAVVITRPEDLRNPTLAAMAGGTLAQGPAPSEVRRTPAQAPERADSKGRRGAAHAPKSVWPTDDVATALTGYTGGNLYPTIFGAAASYGLGELHLLAFDPTKAPAVDDPWVQGRMLELVRHAWDRRTYTVSMQGALFGAFEVDEVRKVLDPNENSRWAIIIAAVLLCGYAVLAGPVNFARAHKRGRPLRALRHLPFWALGAFFVLVLLGWGAKGFVGKARHLTLVEAAPGMPKAVARRFRAFFTSASRSLTVRATDPASVLDAATEPRAGASRSLVVDRDGVQLVGLSTMPWETVVVREDGFASLAGGLTVLREPDGDITIVNRIARDLRAVLVVPPEPPTGRSPRQAR
jgi:hypothetical protein